jgi:glycosyltransferase involved in cell wall biosynthesis
MHAVLGALGEVPDCPASFLGRLLQGWICGGLRRATKVACISQATMNDARQILGMDRNLLLILDALNYPFQPVAADEVERRLAEVPGIHGRFVLHVGSNLTRKNREGVLRVFAIASRGTDLQMVFAGDWLSLDLIRLAEQLEVLHRIVQVVKPPVEIIAALYSRATALLFPSRYEGFGWLPIEERACGCPVVTSNIAPIAEVLGQSAALRPVEDEAGMAEDLQRLVADREFRERVRQRGFENVRSRFQTSRMMGEYESLYREVACEG